MFPAQVDLLMLKMQLIFVQHIYSRTVVKKIDFQIFVVILSMIPV